MRVVPRGIGIRSGSGQIDAYMEYTGTAFTAILKQEEVSDPQRVYLHVKEDYQKRDLQWLEPLGFNNTFATMIRGDAGGAV